MTSSIDKFGRSFNNCVEKETSGLSLTTVNDNFLRRDGANTVIGSIDMGGNTFTNVCNPTQLQEVATKFYVDNNERSNKVSKSGDVMTGNLLFRHRIDDDDDVVRVLGSTDLPTGKRFSLVLGNTRNRLDFENPDEPTSQTPVTLNTTHGLLVRVNGSDVCQLGRQHWLDFPNRVDVFTNIAMLSNRIVFLPDPTYPHEAATKGYIDRKFTLTEKRSRQGHVPPLEANNSKTGFIARASSHKGNRTQPYKAFNSSLNHEWVASADAGPDSFIEISCPTAVRIWKLQLTGRRSNQNRITSWVLYGGLSSDTLRRIHESSLVLGSTMQEVEVDSELPFYLYRIEVVTAESVGEFGISYFQIFTNN